MKNYPIRHALLACLLASIALLFPDTIQAEDTKDILFYGNSFTLGSGSTDTVPDLVRDIATAAGHATPNTVNAAVSGEDLSFHLQSNTSIITTGIISGESWEHVVMQDFSTKPTTTHPDGDRPQHRADAVALYRKAANHSPSVQVVMFETWARAPGHFLYTGTNPVFPGGPSQMQTELREGYALSTGDINAAAGFGTAKVAPVGDAWETANWNNLYIDDLRHAQNRGTLLAALVIYGTIFNDPTTRDINLSGILNRLDLPSAAGPELAGYADAVFEPAAPVLSQGEPSGELSTGTSEVTLSLKSNEIAVCRYATKSGVDYSDMPNIFSNTSDTIHQESFSNVSDGENYHFFIRCQDRLGNSNQEDFVISFSISRPDGMTKSVIVILNYLLRSH